MGSIPIKTKRRQFQMVGITVEIGVSYKTTGKYGNDKFWMNAV
jgi:hypothetical protein